MQSVAMLHPAPFRGAGVAVAATLPTGEGCMLSIYPHRGDTLRLRKSDLHHWWACTSSVGGRAQGRSIVGGSDPLPPIEWKGLFYGGALIPGARKALPAGFFCRPVIAGDNPRAGADSSCISGGFLRIFTIRSHSGTQSVPTVGA